MANRRLNKKVALIGLGILAFFVFVAIVSFPRFFADPQDFIEDGQVAIQAAHEATDQKTKQQHYKKAQRSFHSAYMSAKTDSLREEILFKMVDMYLETQEWPYILGCWDEIIRINPNNAKARYGRLKYFYILAESGGLGFWQRPAEQAAEFLKVAEDAGLLMEDTNKWDVFEQEQKGPGQQRLGPYLYLVRGRAAFEMANLGEVTNIDETLAQAIDDFQKVLDFEPNNIDAYWYLARAIITRGEMLASKGDIGQRDKAIEQATALMEKAVEVAGDDPRATINLLTLKLTLAKGSSPAQLTEKIRSIEPEYLSLMNKFSSSAEALAAVSSFYSIYSIFTGPRVDAEHLDKAIESAEKTIQLDNENVIYAINAAELYYRKYSIYQKQPYIHKAIEIAKNALTMPDAQETPGPRRRARMNNRFTLYAFLANCYIEQIIEVPEPTASQETKALLTAAEQAVHEIEQMLGSGEEPLVIKWRGMLELARGNKKDAVKKLYLAYEQIKALQPSEPPWPRDLEFAQLSYTLAKLFMDTSEIGAVNEFFISAIHSGIGEIKPESRLDYVNVLLMFNQWSQAIQSIDAFKEYYGPNNRSRELRIRAYISSKQFEEAEKELADRDENAPNTIQLRLALAQARIRQVQMAMAQRQSQETSSSIFQQAQPGQTGPVESNADMQSLVKELNDYVQLKAELLEKLLTIEPNSVEQAGVVSVCNNYIIQGDISRARDLVDRFLSHFPDSPAVLVYQNILSEPEPEKISQQRSKEIEKQVLSRVADPLSRAVQLGIFYRMNNELEKATEQLRKALKTETLQENITESSTVERIKLAAGHLFEIALRTKDWKLAEQVVEVVRREDLDNCGGLVFETRLAMAEGEYQDALVKIDECLRQMPVFSFAYMLRSNINASLGNEDASVEDIREASSLNPLDGTIAKDLARALFHRYQRLGDNISSDQIVETRTALEKAIALNPGNDRINLLSMYADFIATTEPLQAMAIRQDIQKADPNNIENAILLGRLAVEVAVKETRPEHKEALFAIADSAFEQAKKIDPQNKRVLYQYAQYLRARGQENKAKALLEQSQDEKLLCDHYFRLGQYDKARSVLEQLYKKGPKDITVVKGLMLVAEKTSEIDAIKKYSTELNSLEDTVENNFLQVRAFLKVGLIKEAQYKLQSFKEKYPNEPRTLLLEAWLLMRQGQLTKALELSNRNLQNNQNNPQAWRLRGEINFLLADYDKAISDLKTSKLYSDEPTARISLAKAFLRVQRYEDAITELKNIINEPGVPLEAGLLLEYIYSRHKGNEELKGFYTDILEKFPDSVQWLTRAGAFAIKTGDFDEAAQLYKKAFLARRELYLGQDQINQIQDVLYATAFDGYLKALVTGAGAPGANNWNPEKLDRAFEECNKYKDGAFGSIAYLWMAQAKSTLGDKAAAIEYCQTAFDKAQANQALAAEVLHRMYSIVGADEVSKYCQQQLQTNPESIAANLMMFNLAKLNNDYSKAMDYIEKCIELSAADSMQRVDYKVKKAQILLLAYESTSDKNYLETAIADYESLLTKMPNNIGVLNNLAYVLAENNQKLSDALQYAKRALEEQPNNAGFMDTYAYVLHKAGRNSQAAEFLTAALQQYEQDKILVPAEVYEHLGAVKEKLGAKDEALAAYKQALEVGADRLSQKAKQRISEAIQRLSL